MNDLGDNKIFAFSETWLKMMTKNYGSSDRKSNEKPQGGGMMIIASKPLSPTLGKDQNKLNPNHFESLSFECNLKPDNSNKKRGNT